MASIDYETVLSTRNRIGSVQVIYNGVLGNWSIAPIDYDGQEFIGFRWNGREREHGTGTPQSRGKPTWELLPPELAEVVQERIEQLHDSRDAELRSAYREMAADREREAEAEEWSERVIGDAANQKG